ncbi:hypothetical protein [Haliangium ochraceum]|uniref:Uncharacterized protein n=1 Tax=Haliangium ochraceum (strain DSM 14365 / JCM 11303 / SMP-2) TaxID=502025 RepID=D0LYV9_HALO1|nr:hypothetical protein [Haliangium ochraceum]ACY14429.1 hypothetical protein Hoch_1882 [Haliangium ochraceum DSM 14365]
MSALPTPAAAHAASQRRLRRSRALRVAACALLATVALGCEESGQNPVDSLNSAWQRAGLSPTAFGVIEDEALKPGTCHEGKVDGLYVVVCRYADDSAAHAAQNTGLDKVGDTTGLSLAAGQNLLIVVDREGGDPTGKKINAIATAFRDTYAPQSGDKSGGKDEGKAEGEAAGKDGDAANDGK